MSVEGISIVVSSADSTVDGYTENLGDDFTVELPSRLDLRGEWSCCLESVQGSHTFNCDKAEVPNPIFVLCDFIDSRVYCGRSGPLLNHFSVATAPKGYSSFNHEFSSMKYIRVVKSDLKHIRIQLVDRECSPPAVSGKKLFRDSVTCALHFRKDV